MQQLREEQRRARGEYIESLRQRDIEIQQLRGELRANQISLSDNREVIADVCDRGDVQLSVGDRDVARLVRSGGLSCHHTPRFPSGVESAVSARVNPSASFHEGIGVKLKPDTYDGSGSLREFLAQFNLIARANRWSEEVKAIVLASSLRGKARAVLENVEDLENLGFVELKSKLELRFGDSQSTQSYYSQFTNRKQKFGENLASLGSDIERLSQLAYPECTHLIRDKVACAQFVSALSDGFIKRTLQLEGVASLRVAVERARAVKLIQESSFERKREQNFDIYKKKENNFTFDEKKETRRKHFNSQSGKEEKTENKFNKFNKNNYQKKIRNERTKECWECGKEGHFRSECPGRTENEK
ncbi:hypothetical protein ALC57_02645 [Trachymyrmex cornetzi]|uniref:CCHC-type domain-containing protein n=1 Tax=Trachymyrmex cornetzi TaxID=471704 RepID=A0A151JN75_9HYME|nr:hypothetical protein ALC57_02645 [Trachymyrmex cornetzi]